MRKKPLGISVVTVALFAIGIFAPLRGSGPDTRSGIDFDPDTATASVATAVMGQDLAVLEERVRKSPRDPKALAQLGLAYLRQARVEADPTFLTRAAEVLHKAIASEGHPDLFTAVGMSLLANERHEFRGSARWARRAIAIDPHSSAPYGLLGDALFQLGHYTASEHAYDAMVTRRPDVGSYLRIAYAQQFRGATHAAIRAMRLALHAAGPTGETAAWVQHQMADIYLAVGDLGRALHHNRIGTQIAPGFVPPTVGVAEVAMARGQFARAIDLVEAAADKLPTLEYLIKLGDLYRATGDDGAADVWYRRAARKIAAYRRNGVRPDVDFIVFYADHDLRAHHMLAEARAIYSDRPTAAAADALAWALHARGRDRAALWFARQTIDANSPGFLVHAGTIAAELGLTHEARTYLTEGLRGSVTLSPLMAKEARRELHQIQA